MKTIAAVVLALGIGFAAGYFYLSTKQKTKVNEIAATESGWQAEKAFLEQALAEAKKRNSDVRPGTGITSVTLTNNLSAREILEKLIKLNPNANEGSRNRVFRQIVFHLQMLAELGSDALPTIRDFLRQNKDVDYSFDLLNASGERLTRGSSPFTSRNIVRTDFIIPPTLRLGLVDVLEQIGGDEALTVLAEVLDTTGRGVEVAYIARVLEDVAPGKYRDNAIKAAKDLLSNPPAIDQPNRLDDNARSYLYRVLAMYRDNSFVPTAQGLILTPDGHVDKQVLGYLNDALKEQAVPTLYAAYKDPRLTNQAEKSFMMTAVLKHAGPSAQANDVFKEAIANDAIPTTIRAMTIRSLSGETGQDRPYDPRVIETRLELLRNLRGSSKDEALLRAMDETKTALEKLLPTVSAK
jgi:hypothetical protein